MHFMMTLTPRSSLAAFLLIASTLLLFGSPGRALGLSEGQSAPAFSLEDTEGKSYDLAKTQVPLLVLYFCDLDSQPNRDGLLRLNRLAGSYKASQLQIWAISLSPRERARHTGSRLNINFPILTDTKGVSELYNARDILPMLYIVENGSNVLGILSGTGKTIEEQLRKLVETRLDAVSKSGAKDFEEFKSRGLEAYDQKRLETASQHLTKALAIKPDRDCYLYLAHTWIELEKDGKAEETLDAAIAAYPKDPRFHETYVDYFLARKDPQRARNALDRGLGQFPEDRTLLALRDTVDQAARGLSTPRSRTLPISPIKKTVETSEQKARSLFNFAKLENQKLTWDTCLAKKALQRAEDMVRKGAFEHKDPTTGKNPAWDLVKTCHKASFAGENLSKGEGQSSRLIHSAFMESSSHRKNILDTHFTLLGVGCHEYICVELFAGF
jgi:uncharacterized protein YkwD/peroxiredoxin